MADTLIAKDVYRRCGSAVTTLAANIVSENDAKSNSRTESNLKTKGRAAFLRAAMAFGNSIIEARHCNDLLVVCYHSVLPDGTADPEKFGNAVSISEFTAQLQVLCSEFHPIAAVDVASWYTRGTSLPARPVLVTFDDGHRNNLEYAAPLLLKYGVPAVIFVTTGYIGQQRLLWPYEIQERILSRSRDRFPLPNGDECELPQGYAARYEIAQAVRECCKKLPFEQTCNYLRVLKATDIALGQSRHSFEFMNWYEVRELLRMGFEIGSHSEEHPMLSRLNAEQLWHEVNESKETIERELSISCRYFAYPNGSRADFSAESEHALRQAEYELAFTTIPSFCSRTDNSLQLGRVVVPDHPSLELFRTHISTLHSTAKRWLRAIA
jgi:peptidoglycan/xylan/chitin deacetylase (PgdA/CDA1 family)